MPLRRSVGDGTSIRLARRPRFGQLADFHVLDTRQFRSDQPCGDGFQPACGGESDPVVLTGDIHCSFAADVLEDFSDPATVVAAEIVGTSAGPSFIEDSATRIAVEQATFAANPHLHFMEGALRGYVLCELDPSRWLATYRGVVNVARSRIDAVTAGFSGTREVLADPDGPGL